MLNIHPALFLSGVSEPEKTSRKSPWILVEKEMNQRPVAKAEMGKKARGALGFPWEVFIQEQIRKRKLSHCYAGHAEAPSPCCLTMQIMPVST